MNIGDFAAMTGLKTEEIAALNDFQKNHNIMQMARQIAEKSFQTEPVEELKIFPESPQLAAAWFVAAYLSIDYSRNKFRSLGYPEFVWLDTMSDMPIWLRHEQRNNNVIGLGEVARWWTALLYNGKIIRRGRLECNTSFIYKGDDVLEPAHHLLLARGDKVINLHIPEDGAMSMDLCSKSLKSMAEFFAECHPEYNWKGFICQSWLLDRQLCSMLPDSSNIVKFQKLGVHYPVDIPADTLFRIFGNQDISQIPNPTLLQRKAADFLRNGGVFREEGMFIERSKLEKFNFDLDKLLTHGM